MAYRRTAAIQARIDARRAAIVGAAGDLLVDGGYAAATIAAVATRAGVSPGTVYKHFASKTDLAAEVFRTLVTREVAAVDAADAVDASATGRVTAVVETFAGRALKHPRRAYALLAEPVDPRLDALRLRFRHAYRDVLARAIAAGVAHGELPPQNVEVVAAALVGAIGEALFGRLATPDADPDTVTTLIAFAHRAIGGHLDAHP